MAFETVVRGGKEFKTIIFGTGDIKISTSHERENNYLDMVILSQDVPKPVEEWEKKQVNKTTDDIDDTKAIILKFSKVKSIDMLIEALEEVRDSMLLNKKGDKYYGSTKGK